MLMENTQALDKILKQTVNALEKSRENINEIGEGTRAERESSAKELETLRKQVQETIDYVDQLQVKEKQARLHLMEVSKHYKSYSEEEVREAYENARELQMMLGHMQERERQLKIRRDQLEVHLNRLNETLEKADDMVSRVGVALDYLIGNLQGLEEKFEEIQQKQDLGLKIILAQEEERKRVAREIHDGPAQFMANLVLRTEICEKILDSKPQEVKKELGELKGMVRESLQELRKIIFDLRPMAIDDLGLVATLKRYLEDFREKHPHLKVEFVHSGAPLHERKDLDIALFRIIQEALSNIVKHSQATEAFINVEINPERINVIVRDNGRGFDQKKVQSSSGYGLLGMRERIELLDGTMDIRSAPGEGTEIKVSVPLQEEKGENNNSEE